MGRWNLTFPCIFHTAVGPIAYKFSTYVVGSLSSAEAKVFQASLGKNINFVNERAGSDGKIEIWEASAE